MKGTRRRAALATVLAAGCLLSAAPPAGGVVVDTGFGSVEVTSPRCGTITGAVAWGEGVQLRIDDQRRALVATSSRPVARASTSWTGLPGGRYQWRLVGTWPHAPRIADGWLTVAPCPGDTRRRAPQGDETGDGRADLLAVTTTGELRLYPATRAGLGPGRTVGHGWQSTVFLQRVKQVTGAGSPDLLVSVRRDGTVWTHRIGTGGRISGGRRVAAGMGGHQHYVVLPSTNELTNATTLFAVDRSALVQLGTFTSTGMRPHRVVERYSQSQKLFAKATGVTAVAVPTDVEGNPGILQAMDDGRLRPCRVLSDEDLDGSYWSGTRCAAGWGSGWARMGLLTSPGSLDGDLTSDLVARREDGNLYLYQGHRGRARTARLLGHNWNQVRLLG